MNFKMSLAFLSVIVLSLGVSAFTLQPIKNDDKSIFDLMSHTEVLEVELYTDFNILDSLKNTKTYQPATLSFENADETISKWGIKIRTRGKYRRRICDRPPIKFNFVKEDLEKSGLNDDDELKLVTQCVPGITGKDYILREYLAYQLYNILSPASFRAQLVRLRYNCTATGDRERSWGIILEDEKTMARRLDAEICEGCYSKPKEEFSLSCLSTATLFQYMIGNSDYSVILNRNLKLLKTSVGQDTILRVAPYDFDFSGLVNANYALPSPDYKQKSVRDRVFLGMCNDQELETTIQHFLDKKEELFDCVSDFKLMSKASRIDIKQYLKEFFEEIESEVSVNRPGKVTGQQ